LPVPVARHDERQPAWIHAGERCRLTAIPDVAAQRDARQAGERELAASEHLESDTRFRERIARAWHQTISVPPLQAGSCADIRPEPPIVEHSIVQRIDHARRELECARASWIVSGRHARELDLYTEPPLRPCARGGADAEAG